MGSDDLKIEIRVEESWSCFDLEIEDSSVLPMPHVSVPVAEFHVSKHLIDNEPERQGERALRQTGLGTAEEPYAMFGVFVAALHAHLVERCGSDASGMFCVAASVIAANTGNNMGLDSGTFDWHWRYTAKNFKLEWVFALPSKYLPQFASQGETIADRISETAERGYLQGRPSDRDYALNSSIPIGFMQ